jgi:ubiquinone/menaquinone biosynthesis C-methylase UbiE
MRKIRRVTAQEGYDLWAESYDETPNPVVAMDARHTLRVLAPKPGEQVLDAGGGTGRHLGSMILAGSSHVGANFSRGMLGVARRNHPGVPLVLADLHKPLPFGAERFDAVLCALIGEHLDVCCEDFTPKAP